MRFYFMYEVDETQYPTLEPEEIREAVLRYVVENADGFVLEIEPAADPAPGEDEDEYAGVDVDVGVREATEYVEMIERSLERWRKN